MCAARPVSAGPRPARLDRAGATAAPDVPIVVLAEHADEQIALQAIRAGAQDFLVKPELFSALLGRSLRYAIERKRSEARLAHLALHFKEINDSLGHAAGDRLLGGLADRLRAMLRPMDTVARFGGDEFTLLFEDLTGESEVVLIAERINRAASLPVRLQEGEGSITVSIGIAMVTDPSIAPDSVIREADAAMYLAKELGRSRYELFDEAARQRAEDRLELESALSHAVERSELRVHYQPRISLNGDPGVASLVGAVVELGHALGLNVVAEGVETDAQLAELRSLGCDAAQGFLLGRPVPEDEARALLVP